MAGDGATGGSMGITSTVLGGTKRNAVPVIPADGGWSVLSVPRMRDGPKMLTVPENQTFRDALHWFGLASHHSMLERSILSGVPFNSLIPCPPFVIQPPSVFGSKSREWESAKKAPQAPADSHSKTNGGQGFLASGRSWQKWATSGPVAGPPAALSGYCQARSDSAQFSPVSTYPVGERKLTGRTRLIGEDGTLGAIGITSICWVGRSCEPSPLFGLTEAGQRSLISRFPRSRKC